MSVLKTAKLRVKIVSIGLAGRILILASVLLFKNDGYFRHDTFRELMSIMSPLACFYVTLFVKFIFQMAYRYPVESDLRGKDVIGFGYYGLLLLNILELFTMLYYAFVPMDENSFLDEHFIACILSAELAFGLIAGLYVAEIFGHNPKDPKA